MTGPAPIYDLVLLLDPAGRGDRARQARRRHAATIEAQGELLRHDDWGSRTLAYAIDHRTAAEYHLMQFHPGSAGADRDAQPHASDHR